MNRQAIHHQISILADKINYLNNNLSKQENLHPVEVDLLNSYENELKNLVQGLKALSDLSESYSEPEILNDEHMNQNQEIAEEKTIDSENKTETVQHEKLEATPKNSKISPISILDDSKNDLEKEVENETVEKSEKNEPVQDNDQEQNDEPIGEASKKTSLNDILKKETAELGDSLNLKTAERLEDLFDLNEKYSFIKELFDGNNNSFKITLSELQSCNNSDKVIAYFKEKMNDKGSKEKSELLKLFSSRIIQHLN